MVMPFYYLVGILTWPVARGLFRLRVAGREHLPSGGGFVVGSNHLSNFDPFAIGLPLWPRQRVRWMAKAELYLPGLATLVTAGGAFKVRRGEHDLEAIETAIRLVGRGDVLIMFPEGTRRRKGLRKKFQPRPHTGAARIAMAAGAPLLPAAIRGTDRAARLAAWRVTYGPPIALDDLAGLDSFEAARLATKRLMEEIRRLEASLE